MDDIPIVTAPVFPSSTTALPQQLSIEERTYQESVFRALLSGSGTRRRLPPEIASYIFELAPILQPLRIRYSAQRADVVAYARGFTAVYAVVLVTLPVVKTGSSNPPAKASCLKIGQRNWIRAVTRSRDQGWTTHAHEGSQSWFEIGLGTPSSATSSGPTKGASRRARRKDAPPIEIRAHPTEKGRELVWKSHHNAMAVPEVRDYAGCEFGPDHEMWDYTRDGDVVLLRACAKNPGWDNRVTSASFEWMTDFKSCL